MPEPVTELLSRFTPDGTGLDRDALLFAAGRASARPRRHWMALAGVLAASQIATLLFLWPRTAPPVAPNFVKAPPPVVAAPPEQPAPVPSAAWALRNQAIDREGNLPVRPEAEPMIPPDPPLHAFASADTIRTD